MAASLWNGSEGKSGLPQALGVFMKKTRTQLAKFAAIAMMSVGVMALSASTVGAAVDLSSGDLQSINTAMSNAISAAKASLPANATQAQIDAAISSAISAETQALITQYSQTNPMLVAEAAITGAVNADATGPEIGTGMAAAALAENSTTGLEIADAVGATGPTGAVGAFQTAATANGGPAGLTLADAALSYENIGAGPGGGGGNGNTQGFFSGGGGLNGSGGSGGGCRNPSCT